MVLHERAYPHSNNHAAKKRRLIGLGGSKTTGATGLKGQKTSEIEVSTSRVWRS